MNENESSINIEKQKKKKPEKKKISLEDFKILKLIGRGNVGHVFLVRLKGTKKFYAMKILNKQEMIERNKLNRVLTERQILATADHPFIVTLHWCFQSSNHIYFVMDHCAGGEFFGILKKMPQGCLPEKSVRFYCAEVLIALEYLHIMGFIYRDLKPENILMDSNGHVLLTDFDLSKQSDNPVVPKVIKSLFAEDVIDTKPELVSNSFVGTPDYIAPEVIEGFGHTSAVDWWTFGVLMYEMLFGRAPFKGNSREEIFQNILENKLVFPENIPVSKECKNLIKKLLCPDPKKRIGSEHGASDIKAHPWFKKISWALVREMKPPYVPETPDLLETFGCDNDKDEFDYNQKGLEKAFSPREDRKSDVN